MINHAEITRVMQAKERPGIGIHPNPYADEQPEWNRRKKFFSERSLLTKKIESLMEPRFITTPEISEMIEALIVMTDSRKILEVGMCTGFTSMHILRAIIGKKGACLVSVDARPMLDREFFSHFPIFRFLEGWSQDVLTGLYPQDFDLVFVDSDHSLEHTQKEFEALKLITHKGTVFLFHDVPLRNRPDATEAPPVRQWLESMNKSGELTGVCIQSCQQADCLLMWGDGYPKECNPGLGIFVRT